MKINSMISFVMAFVLALSLTTFALANVKTVEIDPVGIEQTVKTQPSAVAFSGFSMIDTVISTNYATNYERENRAAGMLISDRAGSAKIFNTQYGKIQSTKNQTEIEHSPPDLNRTDFTTEDYSPPLVKRTFSEVNKHRLVRRE